jgi:hypothetical protein
MQTAGAVENPKAGFPQLLESSIHSLHSADDGDLSIKERDNHDGSTRDSNKTGGVKEADFLKSGLVHKNGETLVQEWTCFPGSRTMESVGGGGRMDNQ